MPTLSKFDPIDSLEDNYLSLTYATLIAKGDESSDTTAFKITALSNGTLYLKDNLAPGIPLIQITTTSVASGVWINASGVTINNVLYSTSSKSLIWVPISNTVGTPWSAFSVKAATGVNGTLSSSDVAVTVSLTSVNDAPSGTNKTITVVEDVYRAPLRPPPE